MGCFITRTMQIFFSLWLLLETVSAAVIIPELFAKTISKSRENSIEKGDIQLPADLDVDVEPGQLEAFYYGIYGDLISNDTQFFGRPGDASTLFSCDNVRQVPEALRHPGVLNTEGLSEFYQKYTEAYGIPVLGSERAAEKSLRRTCYVLRFLLADREDMRQRFYSAKGRVVVMGPGENIKSLPEYKFLPSSYGYDVPGLGAIPIAPVSSAMENNVLCDANDPFGDEDIMIREVAQGLHHLAARSVIPNFQARLQHLYERAIASGWWKKTYAALSADSYFGEGVQSYFNVNGYSRHPDGNHGHINDRAKLRSYDPELYYFIEQLFPCGNVYLKRCRSRDNENYQNLRMDCPVINWSPFI